jgi:hypothetical protein
VAIRDITFGAPLWQRLHEHLLTPNSTSRALDEQLAFVLASYNETSHGTRLIAHELLTASQEDLEHQSSGGIAPTGEFVARALTPIPLTLGVLAGQDPESDLRAGR